MMKNEQNYNKITDLYDIMYTKKTGFNHKLQVKWVDNWRKKFTSKKIVVDLGCGTGTHLGYFKKLGYSCMGIDLERAMLDIAERQNKQISFREGNFKNFKLEEKSPLITMFFNSMGYNTTNSEMFNSLKNIKNNLSKDGLFIFDMFTGKSKNVFIVKTFTGKGINFSKTYIGGPTNKGFESKTYYVVSHKNGVKIIQRSSLRGMFSKSRMNSILKKVGLKVLYLGEGYSKGSTTFVTQKED